MHAVITNVKIASGEFDNARKSLHETVVPRVSKAPGFVRGVWTVDAGRSVGISMVLFNTRADAENAVQQMRSNPMPPGVTLNNAEICEVVAEA
ncbi:MAG TPA: hypothetical protein VJT08_07485 [Terriglobales bacterium]|nr:hypothetical protein [Terriglobales bacterium]